MHQLAGEQRTALLALAGGGARVDAVVHVHPFHTLHVEATHRLLPHATLYGTSSWSCSSAVSRIISATKKRTVCVLISSSG